MTDTERRYAQIEVEARATTWACRKFLDYILGKSIVIETHHKLLVPLLGTKSLDSLPPRVLRFRLGLDCFQYMFVHVPGKQLYIADTLSQVPVSSPTKTDTVHEELAEMAVTGHFNHLPAGPSTLDGYRHAQDSDQLCTTINGYCRDGWPAKSEILPMLKPYRDKQGELTVNENLLLCRGRIVVPTLLLEEAWKKLHQGHQGIQMCQLRAQSPVWWPGLSSQIADLIKRCPECAKDASQEPLIPTALPQYPWQRVGSDLFVLDVANYLHVVDYFSRIPEIVKLRETMSAAIIAAMKTLFARYGVPEIVVSDNGPQYSSHKFAAFASHYNFTHTTSSPHHPCCNGQAERTVNTVKALFKNSADPQLSLFSYRSTPLPWCRLSPAELRMGWKIRIDLPQTSESLTPRWSYLPQFRKDNKAFKEKQKEDFDRCHCMRSLPLLP